VCVCVCVVCVFVVCVFVVCVCVCGICVCVYIYEGKVKVNFTLRKATKVQRGSRGIALPSL